MVLGIHGPADWPILAQVWRGVQADGQWPPAAIAVNGSDAYELWFSLAEPMDRLQAAQGLWALCQRYAPDVPAQRWRLWPAANAAQERMPGPVPHWDAVRERGAAFVAPDLAAVFGDEPALDLPPGDEAQAEVLSRIQPIPAADWQRVIPNTTPAALPVSQPTTTAPAHDDPRRFLLSVMNDTTVDMALRVEAAKALLK
jgi:hypothetical protein